MKKIIVISLIAVMSLLLLGACVKNDASNAAAASSSVSAPETASEPADETASDTAATQSSADAGATPGSVIISESSNTISDSEKEEVLNGLMGEIDSVLGSIDSLEDLEDSDLGTDDID